MLSGIKGSILVSNEHSNAMNKMELTMMVEEGENGYLVGQLVEYPAALSQGKTIEELENNLKDALKLLLQVQDNIQPTWGLLQ